MTEKLVLYIDDTLDARSSYVQDLEDIFGSEVCIETSFPLKTINEMLTKILDYTPLIALVIDERLGETGLASYKGIELAEVVRGNLSKLPIYILTNYPEDIINNGFLVEYVLDKNKLTDDDNNKIISARIRRHLNVYDDILSERESRYAELLSKNLNSKLTTEEKKEFADLDLARIKPLSHEFIEDKELKEQLDKQSLLLKKIHEELEQDD